MAKLKDIKRIAEFEFGDIVDSTYPIGYKMRIILSNNSFIDVYISQELKNTFAYHWECMDKKRTIYRYDNIAHKIWGSVKTFPYHFHNGSQNEVEASPFALNVLDGFRDFMTFVRNKI